MTLNELQDYSGKGPFSKVLLDTYKGGNRDEG